MTAIKMVYPICRMICKTISRIFLKEIKGINNIPKQGPFVFCSNHASFLDDVFVPGEILLKTKKHVHMYVNSRFYKNMLLKILLNHYRCIPVSIEKYNYSKEKNKKAFNLALKYLKKGEPIGIFPEGRRSPNGKLQKAKNGAAKIALTAKIPILPIGMVDSYYLWPKGKTFPKIKKRIRMNIGKPMYFDKYYGKINKKNLRLVTNTIMKEIARLSNQKYRY